MSKGGRPKFDLDWDQLDKICAFPMKQEDIAWIMGCSLDTLCREVKSKHGISFAEYHDKKKSRTKALLHQKQWDLALKGNVTLLIWLGKQYLGQSDKVEQKTDITTAGDKISTQQVTPDQIRRALEKIETDC